MLIYMRFVQIYIVYDNDDKDDVAKNLFLYMFAVRYAIQIHI